MRVINDYSWFAGVFSTLLLMFCGKIAVVKLDTGAKL